MSEGTAPKQPQLAKHSTARKVKRNNQKEHKYDPRLFHQNANRHGIHALVQFDCPVCQCKNTVKVALDAKRRLATVKCGYCVSLQPRPAELPYPFETPYVPKLENRADAFFRFSDAYQKLAAAVNGGAAAASTTPVTAQKGERNGRSGLTSSTACGLLDGLDDLWEGSGDRDEPEEEKPEDIHLNRDEGVGSTTAVRDGEVRSDTLDRDEGLVDDVGAFFDDD